MYCYVIVSNVSIVNISWYSKNKTIETIKKKQHLVSGQLKKTRELDES